MIRKTAAILGSAVFAPGFVAVLAPWWVSHWRLHPPFFGLQPLRLAGGVLMGFGAVGLLDSFLRFAVQGMGTPAPVFPTRHLVVTGLYRFVRNPMYVAAVSAIIGQGLIFGNVKSESGKVDGPGPIPPDKRPSCECGRGAALTRLQLAMALRDQFSDFGYEIVRNIHYCFGWLNTSFVLH